MNNEQFFRGSGGFAMLWVGAAPHVKKSRLRRELCGSRAQYDSFFGPCPCLFIGLIYTGFHAWAVVVLPYPSLNSSLMPPMDPSMLEASNGRNTVLVCVPVDTCSSMEMYFCASR